MNASEYSKAEKMMHNLFGFSSARRNRWLPAFSLSLFLLGSPGLAQIRGDLDNDGDIDRNDLDVILAASGSPANGDNDPRDLDGDGTITAGLDGRQLTLLCTRPRCALESGLEIAITEPMPGIVTAENLILVSGTAVGASSVEVNGIQATLSSGAFSVEIPLVEGTNRLVATAESATETATESIIIRRDTEPPFVVIESPGNGDRIVLDSVTIAGTVNDIIPGATVNEDDVTVFVNGQRADVMNRTFILADLPLETGINTVTAMAVDRAGNSSSTTIEVERRPDLSGIRLIIVEGNNQQGPINSQLSPFTVQLLSEDGSPIAGRPIEFEVSRGDGLLGAPGSNERVVRLLSGGNGEATVNYQLGSRTGEGSHRVRVTTPGSLTYAEFCATARAMEPANIAITMMPPLRGVAGQFMSDSLSVIVTDAGGNPVALAPVTFQVDFGGGHFFGQESLRTVTNRDGIAAALLTLGPDSGRANNRVSVNYDGNAGLPAVFLISGIAAGPAGQTSVSGVVQNSAGDPIEGTRAVIRGTSLEAFSGADGRFRITGVSPGGHRVGVIGSAANNAGAGIYYPDIDFTIQAVAGADNPLDQVVTLPLLDSEGAKMVGGNEDVILEMRGVEGFAVKVFANSVILPDGTRGQIMMSSSQVKLDKIPMAPPQGATPLVVGTLQPVGIRFDPPAQVIYPNLEGLSPGDVADIFSFRHDLGQFVNVGPGTVSEDGSVVISDPGFGITESGWHCLSRIPGPTAECANDCSSNYSWEIVSNGTGGRTNSPVCMIANSTDVATNAAEAKITLGFQPEGGMITGAWQLGSSGVAEIIGDSGNESMVTIRANSAGAATLTSPTYTIEGEGGTGDITCQEQIEVNVLTLLGGPNVKIRNLNEGDINKSASVIWSSAEEVDLTMFLADPSLADRVFWRHKKEAFFSTEQTGRILDYGGKPSFEDVDYYTVKATLEECGDAIDEMLLIVVPKDTQDAFNAWFTAEIANDEWVDELPAPYSELGGNNTDPEPSRCNPQRWRSPELKTSNFHPGGSIEMRSEPVGTTGHQAIYGASGELITQGAGAGTADRGLPFTTDHLQRDVKPFVWAAQLDANPVECSITLCSNLDRPLMHQGEYIGKYIQARPTLSERSLNVGKCEGE